jgi:hypothetical protein
MFHAKSALSMNENSQFEEEFDEIHYYKSALSQEQTTDESKQQQGSDDDSSTILVKGMESMATANRDDIIHVPMVPRTDI